MKEIIKRRTLYRVKRENLERLATYLKLRFNSNWSDRQLARLIYWRLSRN